RFSTTGTGKFVFKKSGRGHLLRKKNAARLRRLRQKGIIQISLETRMRTLLPYA
ncbi:MAG TPA: 50S ribosomal protein L35, partial [Synergistales bacterium]|nr:50S ribosomal protein L35 [Synergistales bacterium]